MEHHNAAVPGHPGPGHVELHSAFPSNGSNCLTYCTRLRHERAFAQLPFGFVCLRELPTHQGIKMCGLVQGNRSSLASPPKLCAGSSLRAMRL